MKRRGEDLILSENTQLYRQVFDEYSLALVKGCFLWCFSQRSLLRGSIGIKTLFTKREYKRLGF